jgi:hypothetical protein
VEVAVWTEPPLHEPEELHVFEGDLDVEAKKMIAGDYCRGEPGSVHGEVWTESSGPFPVLSSQEDEIIG